VKTLLLTIAAAVSLSGPAQAAPESLTLEAGARTITFGEAVTLSGVVSPVSPGDRVTVLALPFHGGAVPTVADPDPDGGWRVVVRPLITTQFRAVIGVLDSAETPVVAVRPRVHLVVLSARRGLFYTRAEGLFGLRGRRADLQLLGAGGWRTLRSVRLGRRGAVRFRARLPRGTSRIRVLVAAGAGYARGLSRTALLRR
jgi:hypothetical protein